ncbi:hypothetical protein BUALT_Bualt07G0041100 [Buddleja alternifolia]|uniref:Uncharacterized protein n=1 Tax=Buddleja alternifolia TaxID=168488 RepID=A0AAV6XIR0_9LAMI|nr:hypothetical protein BUALT_Bualt07G0041100 [Buddleja alternifolia]
MLLRFVGLKARQLPQVSRPVTRNFFAQLLANAQSTAIENCKVNGGAIVDDGALPKPQPEDIIELSRDGNEVCDVEKPVGNLDKDRRRRKAACGLRKKLKVAQNVDIGAADVDNDLAIVKYVEEIYKF